MKIIRSIRARRAAGALLVALVMVGLLCFGVVGYLALVQQQSRLSARSQSWNLAMTAAEAGIEEGLQVLNNGVGGSSGDGWTYDGTNYTVFRDLGGGTGYSVTVDNQSNPAVPTIISRGRVRLPALAYSNPMFWFATVGVYTANPATVVRAVRVRCSQGGLFTKAMVARNTINLNGNDIASDSFDSTDPAYSTNGQYDSTKTKDNGDVLTNDTITNSISLGNANIYGHVSTGPGGTVTVGPNGGIGERTWQNTHNGVQSGGNPPWLTHDANFTFPDTTMPSVNGALVPSSGSYNGVAYDHVLTSGTYVMNSLSGSTIVVGPNVRLILTNGFSMSGNDSFTIAGGLANASVTVYAAGASCAIGGNGVINQPGQASRFIMYCAPSVTSFSLSGNGGFTGVLVAPNVNINLNGGGNNVTDFIGSLIVNSVRMNGHFHFHYDEALKNLTNGRFLVSSWDEINPFN